MANISTVYADAVLNWYWGGNGGTPPATFYLGLATNSGDDFTEMSGLGYSRQAITFGTASGGAILNDSSVTFTASSAWGTIYKMGVFDASTAGNRLTYKYIVPFNLGAGASKTYLAGSIKIEFG